MPIEITMPKLSDTMTEGTLVKWLKQEGDAIKPGDIIAEVETDKATQELEAFETGVIAKRVIQEGGKTAVGGVIVVIAKPGEDVGQVAAGVKAGPVAVTGEGSERAAVTVSASGALVHAAEVESAPEAPVGDVEEGAERTLPPGKMRISPLARRMAEEMGVDVAKVRGSGPDGRIIKRDVLEAAARVQRVPPAAVAARPGGVQAAGPSAGVPVPVAPVRLERQSIPLSSMRQTIARRLVQSKQQIPHFYATIDVLADRLLDLRASVNRHLAPEKLSVTDFIARATARALVRVPGVNASFGETAIIQHGTVDLGIAVALEAKDGGGLVVPVLRSAHTKSLRQISAEIRQLAERARARKLSAQDLTGSTFSITNLGMYGIKDFYAIINPPEAAILAVGATAWQPVVNEQKQIVPAQVMTLTLSADHRVVDGAVGAQFLTTLKGLLESPAAMLI